MSNQSNSSPRFPQLDVKSYLPPELRSEMQLLEIEQSKFIKEKLARFDEYLQLKIKPKPFWMPKFLYKWLLKQITIITTYV